MNWVPGKQKSIDLQGLGAEKEKELNPPPPLPPQLEYKSLKSPSPVILSFYFIFRRQPFILIAGC